MRFTLLLWALLRLLVLLPVWLFGLALFALGLGLSPWGTGELLDQASERGLIELEAHEGAPLDRLVLHGLRLEAGPARVAVERLELAWAEDCLLDGRLCLDTLAAKGVRVRLAGGQGGDDEATDAAGGDGAGEMPDVSLPFPVSLRSLVLEDVDVALADGTRVHWDHFGTGAEAEGDTLRLLPTRLSGARVLLPVTPGRRLALSSEQGDTPRLTAEAIDGAIASRSPLPARAAASLEEAEAVPLEDRPRRRLPEITLPLALEVPELVVEDFALGGAAEYAVERLSLRLEGRGQEVEVAPLEVATADGDARLEARLAMRDDYPLQARLRADLALPEIFPELAGERLDLRASGSLAELDLHLTAEGPVEAGLEARLDALDPTLPFEARLRSDALRWPLTDDEAGKDGDVEAADAASPWRVEDLEARLRGSLLDYRVALSSMVEGPQLPRTRVALTGTGDSAHFAWTPLSLTQGEGSVISRGRVDWSETLTVSTVLRLDALDPSAYVEALPGRLGGDAELSFTRSTEGWSLEVPRLAIDGELQGRPLALDARLTGDSEMRWDIDALDLRQGDNRLSAVGRVDDRALDLAGELDLPSLDSLYPALAGRVAGEFTAGGSLEAPDVALRLDGEGLAFAEHRLGRLALTAASSGLEDPDLDLSLDLQDIDAAGQRFSAVGLVLDGRLSQHRLTLDVDAAPGMPLSRAALALEGGLDADREAYSGRLTPLEADTDFGELRLAESLAFDVDVPGAAVRLDPFCLERRQGGALCLADPLAASAERGQARLVLRDLPMAMLDEVAPEGWALDGATGGELIAEWAPGGDWQALLELDSELSLTGQDAYGQPWELPASRISLAAEADPEQADLELALGLAEAGEAVLDLRVRDPVGAAELEGRLRLDALRLSPYQALVTGLDGLEGEIDGNVGIGGDRQAPTLDGRIDLTGLQVAGGELPLDVTDGELAVRLDGDRGSLDGFIDGEEGRLAIDGEAAWPSPDDWRIDVDLDGREDPLLATLPAFGRLRLAPDLSIRVVPERLQVRGAVQVPWARLEIGELPESAVGPSPDEVIITRRDEERMAREAQRAERQGEEGADESAARALGEAGMAMDVRIELGLGPDMQLLAYGLETGLSGTLEVRQGSGPVQLFGDVNLTDGRFQAFGQDLLVREGQLLFSGPPDQPLLDFEAIRNPEVTDDDVIAGLRVTGSAMDPQARVFSEPAMDEARALSYLLRGRAPDGGGDTDSALASALVGLTLGRTGGAVGAIGEAFGVDDLSLESAGTGDDSQVVVSGQLTEDLRIGYGVGIFSPIAELTLRYTLWRNLYLEAVSGAAQAVDLVYTFSLPGDPPSPGD